MHFLNPTKAFALCVFCFLILTSCQKDQDINTTRESTVLQLNSVVDKSKMTPGLTNTMSYTWQAEANWKSQLLDFHQYTEEGLIGSIPESSLQHLGDLLDADSFQTASIAYNLPVYYLQQVKSKYASAATYWYNNVYLPQQSALSNMESTMMNDNEVPIDWIDDNPCKDIFDGCVSEANANYFFRIGACYSGSILVGTFGTPIAGGAFAIGCGLYVGRVRQTALTSCNAQYRLCK